jgi:hypothetical protein
MIFTVISKCLKTSLIASLIAMTSILTWASPGAHGPNGEHLDTQNSGPGQAMQPSLRIEAKSELFELVGTLGGGELSILIDRFASNEPVLEARVEVESGGLKAQAKFHADLGDYAVDDPAMLQLLSTPGDHALVITVLAGKDSDLLDTVLHVTASLADHDNHFHWVWWALGALAILVLFGIAVAYFRSQRQRPFAQGGQL